MLRQSLSILITAAVLTVVALTSGLVSRAGEAPTSNETLKAVLAQWQSDDEANKPPANVEYYRRILAIAQRQPTSDEACEAALWIVERPGPVEEPSAIAEISRQATDLLVANHANDMRLVRACCNFHNLPRPKRERLIVEVVSAAREPMAQGLARIALAKYLLRKANLAEELKLQSPDLVEPAAPNPWRAYLRGCDPAAARQRVEQALAEVLDRYGEIPFSHARAKTLGEVATRVLDELRNLRVGKPAPEIDGLDLDGRALKLSDYRGKVVLLVFWASWCGPCMAAVPEELKVYERFQDRPLVMLGISGDFDLDEARQAVAEHQIPWKNWRDTFDIEDKIGPIRDRYHVYGIPHLMLLDATGTIRGCNLAMQGLESEITKLLEELRAQASAPSVPK